MVLYKRLMHINEMARQPWPRGWLWWPWLKVSVSTWYLTPWSNPIYTGVTISVLSSCWFLGLMRYLNNVFGVWMPPDQFWHCTIVALTLTTATLCSTLFIISMTFDRFYSTIMPHKAASFNMVKRAKLIIFFIIFVSVVCNIPHGFLTTDAGGQCLPYGKAAQYTLGQIYYYFSNVLNWAFSFVSLLIMNTLIIHTLRKRLKFNISTTEGPGHGQVQSQNFKIRNSEKQAYTLLLSVTFGFLVLTTPMYALSVYTKVYDYMKTPHSFAGFYLFYSVAQKAYYTNFGINFYLYVISGQKFRSDLVKLIRSNHLNTL